LAFLAGMIRLAGRAPRLPGRGIATAMPPGARYGPGTCPRGVAAGAGASAAVDQADALAAMALQPAGQFQLQ